MIRKWTLAEYSWNEGHGERWQETGAGLPAEVFELQPKGNKESLKGFKLAEGD